MCDITGLTYRQLNYMVDTGIITPSVRGMGSGTKHRWSLADVRLVRLAAVLMAHGADRATLIPALAEAADLTDEAWSARVLVTLGGRITTLLGADLQRLPGGPGHVPGSVADRLAA